MQTPFIDSTATWRKVLAQANTKIVCLDFDGTIWSDILVELNEKFGPTDEVTGEKIWHRYDHAFKVAKTMTNGDHLQAEYDDIFATKSLAQVIAYLESQHKLIDGVVDFLAFLKRSNITPIGITNGASQIAEAMLKHHGIDMLFVGNKLVQFPNRPLPTLEFFHDGDNGIDKGRLLREASDLGHQVVAFAGDSRGDISGAVECAKLGGLVLASGANGGLAQFCASNLPGGSYVTYETFDAKLMQVIQQRLTNEQ